MHFVENLSQACGGWRVGYQDGRVRLEGNSGGGNMA